MTAVQSFFDALDHPRKAEIERLAALIPAADPRLVPGIKWNAPSFAIGGLHCITMRLAPRDTFQLVFHRDAKPDATPFVFADPTGLLVMKAPDRGVLDFRGRTVAALEDQVTLLARAWTEAVTGEAAPPRQG